jgi:hypothetical protein
MNSKRRVKKPRLCPCGLDLAKVPHSEKICAPTLGARLCKLAAEYKRTGAGKPPCNIIDLSSISTHPSIPCAFPHLLTEARQLTLPTRGCASCGSGLMVAYIHDGKQKRISKFGISFFIFLCRNCVNVDICPFRMEPESTCTRRNLYFIIWVLRKRWPKMPKDIQRMIAMMCGGRCTHVVKYKD